MLVPPGFLDLYPENEIPLSPSLRDPLNGKPEFQKRGKFRILPTVTDEQFRQIMVHYYALITHIDNQVGRLINMLKAQNQHNNTIVADETLKPILHGVDRFVVCKSMKRSWSYVGPI